jgi:hypothetical protein
MLAGASLFAVLVAGFARTAWLTDGLRPHGSGLASIEAGWKDPESRH